ncbi:rubrerythrin family protein [Infirmifilum lucidum]|uniref:Rubrerythrin family protein n=1 Tax=Infirmifilum lucidum TaxID=2776706 RepID=A0A7L9FIK3_9CREN|nr:VIT1/CCC1 family protein [Infirmifilum lucidum]QOJ78754.1 rubrerythrin family protein [Infirmifilum lucidum]
MEPQAGLAEKARVYALDELFDSRLYRAMAERERDPKNRAVLLRMAEQEYMHYEFWKKFCGDAELNPRDELRLRLFMLSSRILGKVFTIKFLERHEKSVVAEYTEILESGALSGEDSAELKRIIEDEKEHESALADQIEEFAVRHLGAIALGMSDAIIELSGVHAGFLGYTSSSVYTGIAGLIVGVSASMSMAAAAYLQSKQEKGKAPGATAAVTGVMYMLTVILLTAPFLLGLPILKALTASLVLAFIVLAFFSFYSSVVMDRAFARDYLENVGVIFLVVVIGYLFGELVKKLTGIAV